MMMTLVALNRPCAQQFRLPTQRVAGDKAVSGQKYMALDKAT
jgi:hypothetical protein